ncbi:MAG: hypothetical protein KDH88_03590 [Chromatiales bacterium]|nr:hypothetical protein [Chromatiales bacterium]
MPPTPKTRGASGFDWIRFLLLVALLFWGCHGHAQSTSVAILAPAGIAAYEGVIDTLLASAPGNMGVFDSEQTDVVKRVKEANPDLIISLGLAASQLAMDRLAELPLVVALVSQSRYRELTLNRQNITAVYLEQPLSRLLALARVALPREEPVGLMATDPNSRRIIKAYLDDQPPQRLVFEPIEEDQDFESALRTLLTNCRVLVAFHDTNIFNRSRLPVILLSSYHYSVPVIAYTRSMVEAGAALGLYTTPEQFGAQLGDLVRFFFRSGSLPAPAYPEDFDIMINGRVSRSLGLDLPDKRILKATLLRTQR